MATAISGVRAYMLERLTLSFAIKRGVVWPSDEDLETSELIDRCKRLIGMQRFKEACDLLLPVMSLSWTWSQADMRPAYSMSDADLTPDSVFSELEVVFDSVHQAAREQRLGRRDRRQEKGRAEYSLQGSESGTVRLAAR